MTEKKDERPAERPKVISGKVLDQTNPQHSYQVLETWDDAGTRRHMVLDRMMTGAKGRAMIMDVDSRGDGSVAIVRLDCESPKGFMVAGMREMKAFEEQPKPMFSRRLMRYKDEYQKIICKKEGRETANGDQRNLQKILLNAPMTPLPDH